MAAISMPVALVRILLVDDFEPWRHSVRSMLKRHPHLRLVGEVADGVEAVQEASKLHPDLILLDIGLPNLNGIEAAKQIRQVVPGTRILFLTLNNDPDVVRAALDTGAKGYVLKRDAGSELWPAIEAVLQGKQFISSGLVGRLTRRHEVQFYADDASFLDGFTRFITDALKAGDAAIVIATESHLDSLFQRLEAHGLDVYAAKKRGSYVSLDVADTLSMFMVDDLPEPSRFLEVASSLVSAAAKARKGERPRVAACGECAPVLLAQGKADAAIRLEQLWDGLARTHDVEILCGYSMTSFHGEEGSQIFERICAEHSAVHSQ